MSFDTFQPQTFPIAKHEIWSHREAKSVQNIATTLFFFKAKLHCWLVLFLYDNTSSRFVLVQ